MVTWIHDCSGTRVALALVTARVCVCMCVRARAARPSARTSARTPTTIASAATAVARVRACVRNVDVRACTLMPACVSAFSFNVSARTFMATHASACALSCARMCWSVRACACGVGMSLRVLALIGPIRSPHEKRPCARVDPRFRGLRTRRGSTSDSNRISC